MYKHILVPIDGSKLALKAATQKVLTHSKTPLLVCR